MLCPRVVETAFRSPPLRSSIRVAALCRRSWKRTTGRQGGEGAGVGGGFFFVDGVELDGWRQGFGVGQVASQGPTFTALPASSIHERPPCPQGDETLKRAGAVEPVGIDGHEPTQRLLDRIVDVMGDATAGPPNHAAHDGHERGSRHAERFGDPVAKAGGWVRRWVRRWVKPSRVCFWGLTGPRVNSPIVVVTTSKCRRRDSNPHSREGEGF